MTQTHSSERPAICPESFRRQRVTIASVCDDFTDSGAGSQRQYAQDHGIPRSTLGSWLRLDYADYPELEPQLVDFLLTAAGQRFLRRLIVATFTTFHFQAACGIRPVGDFLTRAGLHHFVGTSYGALHSLASQLRDDLAIFAAGERQRLAPLMPTKTIAVVGDENFHSQRPCLVALEPVSNFVLVEAYREHRDADTWTAALQEGLRDLPVQVVLLGSDRAKGLRKCANAGLEVPHSPDLFHDLRNFLAPLRPALNGPILQAQKELDEAKDELQRLDDKESRKPPEQQRSISAQEFATIAGLIRQENAASQRLAATTQRRDEVLRQVRGLGDDYHPFDRHSGRPVSAEELAGRLEKRVAGVEQWTEGLPLSEAAEAAPGKLRVWLTEWVAVVAWFWTLTLRRVEALELSEEGERLVKECLLETVARKWSQSGPSRSS
jgi:hypothetical protein